MNNNLKQIVLIHKDQFQKRPPVISVLIILKSLGYNVALITTGISDEWKKYMKNNNINYYIVNQVKSSSIILKLYNYFLFKRFVYKKLSEFHSSGLLLWIEGAYTIVSLGKRINNFKHILQIQELHEKSKLQLRAISKVIGTASAVFMPEYNRTVFYKVWFNITRIPYLLPNKPYFLPTSNDLDKISQKYNSKIQYFKNKKVILYQGHIGKDRDLTNYVKAVKMLGDDYVIVLIGTDYGMVNKYKEIDSRIIHIDYIPAPDYFVFTRQAYIGIVTYNFISLNNAYCAPNKIWEYAYFGLPMIGNDIPGLRYTIFHSGAGECVDEFSSESIVQAILRIDRNYLMYNKKSKKFFESSNNRQIISDILETL